MAGTTNGRFTSGTARARQRRSTQALRGRREAARDEAQDLLTEASTEAVQVLRGGCRQMLRFQTAD